MYPSAILGKDRIDLAVDPPPDLAIESDFTSKTRIDAYLAIRVPELWVYDAGGAADQSTPGRSLCRLLDQSNVSRGRCDDGVHPQNH